MPFPTFRSQTAPAAGRLLAGVAALSRPAAAAQGTELQLRNAADVALVHVHAADAGQAGDGPDHLDGQPPAPGEDARIEIPGDACRRRRRLVWLDGATMETTHDACSSDGPLAASAP
jgi:hypothetical protein